MKMTLKDKLPLDAVASLLAADAGHAWSRMSEFPGYNRRVWRDEARTQIREHAPDVRIECLPPTWDDREGVCFIRRD